MHSTVLYLPRTINPLIEMIEQAKPFFDFMTNNFYFSFESKKIKSTDIYISHAELKILESGGRAGDNKEPQKNIPMAKRKLTSTDDIRSKCSDFIKNILFLYYKDEEVKHKPWLLIREDKSKGESTELENDFLNLGLDLPSRKTLKRWTEEK